MAKYLSEMPDNSFIRTSVFPVKSNNLAKGAMLIIPTLNKDNLINILDKFKSSKYVIKFRVPKTMYIMRRKKVKVGNRIVTYLNSDISTTVREWKKRGYTRANYVLESISDDNGSIDYCEYMNFVKNNKFTMTNIITFWQAFFQDMSQKHMKFLVWTPETVVNNYITVGSITRSEFNNLDDLYKNFLWQIKYNKDNFIPLLRQYDIKLVFTDYMSVAYFDFNDERYDKMKPTEVLLSLFKYNRRMRLGSIVETKTAEDIETFEDEEEIIVESTKDDIVVEEIIDNSEEDIIDASIIDKLNSISKVNKNDEKAMMYADAIIDIIEKTNAKNKVRPEEKKHLVDREAKIKQENMKDLISMLEKANRDKIDPRLVKAEGVFTKFNVSDMDKSYRIKQEKEDRMSCLSILSSSKTAPLFLTNYKEVDDLESTDAKVKSIQVTYQSPHDHEISHTFTFKLPTLREDKFLYLGNSDKTMSRHIINLPIVRLKEKVAFTTYYKKMFIEPVNAMAHISRQVAKIKRFIKSIRKSLPLKKLYQFDFHPSYSVASKNNYFSDEMLEVSRYLSRVTVDDDNYIDFSATSHHLGKIDGVEYVTRDDDYVYSSEGEKYTLIEFFDGVMSQTEVKDEWKKAIAGRYTNNLLYATTTAVMSNLPVLWVILHALDYNLLAILDRLKEEYNLDYQIIPYDTKISKSKNYDVEDDIVFANFILRLKYNNISNRTLLAPLLNKSFDTLKDLNVEDVVADDISNNLKMELDNFHEMFIDPISKSVMEDKGIPSDYVGALIYCNALLFNYNRPINEISLVNQRIPSNAEIIQGALYKAISNEYSVYSKKIKNGANPKKVKFSIAPDAVIKVLQESPNIQESSKLNPVEHVTSLNVFTGKGLAGLGDNKDRSFTLRRRMWDDTFVGIVSDVSPYSATTGINRQLVMNPNITSIRGYFDVDAKPVSEYTEDETMSISEGLGTFAQKHDSSNRLAMGMQQFTHLMPTEGSEPSLITYGMDESLSYLDSDFVYRARMEGKILAINKTYIKIKYDDGEESVYKFDEVIRNAAKAFYIPNTMKINDKLKAGDKVSKDTVLAYNTMLYDEFDDNLPIFKSGPIALVAVAHNQESYEDAVVISESLAARLKSKTVKRVTARLQASDIIGEFYKFSDKDIQPGEMIIKYLKTDGKNMNGLYGSKTEIDDILSTKVISHYQGKLRDIYIHHKLTEKDKMHKSIKEFFQYVEDHYNKKESTNKFRTNYKLDNNRLVEHIIGYPISSKTKVNTSSIYKGDILIEFFIEVDQPFSVGDKITFGNTALKGVCSTIRKDDERPYGEKTGRKVDAIISPISPLARIVYSFFMNGVLSSCMVTINDEIQKIINEK